MYKISLYYFSKFDFQNKKIKGNGGVLLKEREEKAKLTTNTHAHTTHSLRLLCCTICDIQNHVNKQKLQTRLLGDYSNQSRIHEGTSPGKQRTELWTKAQQNLLISFDFFLSWGMDETVGRKTVEVLLTNFCCVCPFPPPNPNLPPTSPSFYLFCYCLFAIFNLLYPFTSLS